MSNKSLVICDQEIVYASKLADYLAEKKELDLQIRICKKVEQLEVFQQEKKIDILLIDKEIEPSEDMRSKINKIILLSAHLNSDLEGLEEIYRYQSAKEISAKLIEILARDKSQSSWKIRRARGRLIGVYSPIKRLGQTTFTLRKGKELAKKENVLYLNLESYSGIGGYFPEEKKRDLSMLLYYAKQETGNIGLFLTTLVKQMEGMDYIPPVLVSEELVTISKDEWLWLFEEILTNSIYDVLILDLGDRIQGIFEILKACDEVYLPITNDQMAVAKLCQYEEILCRQGYEELWERMIHCDLGRATEK